MPVLALARTNILRAGRPASAGFFGTSGSPLDAYKLGDGTLPSVVLDFVNGFYYDGTATPSTIGALLTGTPTTDANGLIPTGDNTIQAKGALATAMALTSTGATVAAMISRGNQQIYQFPLTMGANAFMYLDGAETPQKNACFASATSSFLNFNPSDFTGSTFFASGYSTASPKRSAMVNDQAGQQDDNAFDVDHPVYFGWWTSNNFPFGGRTQCVVVYPKRLTAAQLPQIRALAPFSAKNRPGLLIPVSGYVTLATSALKIERTQPWSCVANFATANINASFGGVLFSNVINAPYCGYEIWIQGTRTVGRVCVRIMQDLLGSSGAASAIDLYGSINVQDGASHMIGVTYDGSSTAAGVKIYVDGVQDTSITVAQDNLAGSILGNAGQMYVGNQSGAGFGGNLLNFLAMSNVVRSGAYMTACSSYANKPALDASTTYYPDFTTGSGSSLPDLSINGYTGTITGSTWY